MPIIRTLKETGHSYEAAKQRLLEATAHLKDDDHDDNDASRLKVHRAPKRNRIISDSSSSSSSSSSNGKGDDDEDDDGDDDGDDDEEEEMVISQKRQRSKEKKLMRNLEKEMKRKRTIVSISRPSSYQRTEMHAITPAKPKTKKPKSSMSMISALNESSEEPDSDEESDVELTKEAQEEEAFSLYRKALEFQRSGNVDKAQEIYNELLQTRFLSKVKASHEERRGGVTNTAITLKYSTYKNLGNLATAREDTDNAMENYLEAVNLDSTDVTLWYKIGTVAIKLSQLALARVAFEQGVRCSKLHWPCLDYLCTVLYAINDYVTCLYYVAQALEKDKRYTKGFALREQIFSEQPCLRRDCLDLFKHCDEDIFYHEIPKDKHQKIIDEALSLRYTRQKLAKAPPLPRIKFLEPLTELRWKPLGERLIALYDYMTSKDPPMSLITVIDLENYKNKEIVKDAPSEEAIMGPSPTPMDVDPSNQTNAAASSVPSRREDELDDCQIPTDTPGQKDGETPGQMGGETQDIGESSQTDAEVAMDVDPLPVEEIKPVESKTMTDPRDTTGTSNSTLGSSAQTLKQLAEAYLKSLASPEERPVSTEMGKDQEQPDSTTADSTPVTCDLANMELQEDSAAGSSQDSIQQSGRESNMGESSSQDKDTVPRQQTRSDIQHEDAVSMDTEESQSEKTRRGPKKKKMLRDFPAPGKRRSARVRNTTTVKQKKEEEEIVNYTEVLRQFLPSTLLVSDDEDEDMELTKTAEKETKKPEVKKTIESPVNDRDALTSMETDDVHSLLVECQLNNGIVDVMSRYLERLVAKHDLRWPDGLAAVFLDVYKRLRKHINLPELLCCDEDEQVVREMSMMCLLSAEINLDQCLSAKTNGNTPAASPAMLGANTSTCTHKWGEHHEDDMMYLQELTLMQYMLPDLWPVVPARVYWLKARYYLQVGKTADGEEAFERCKDVLEREEKRRLEDRQIVKEGTVEEEGMETDGDTDRAEDEMRPVEIQVANIKNGPLISLASISSEVESLQRCQSLEQIQRLHASGKYGKVVELLHPTLRHTPRPVRPENTPERCSQLILLIQSQMELKDTKESIICCVLGMVETWQGVQREGLQVYHQLWLETLNKLLIHLQKSFESCEISSLGVGGTGLLRKAVNVVIKIIEWTMDQGDLNDTTNATTILPWIVLYHIIKYEEDHLAAKSLPSSDTDGERSCSPSSVPMLPSSLMLLENAHDYLGRQSWCCNCEGMLLKLYIRVLSTELGKYSDDDERHPFFGDLRHTLEQCFFCLYGHPTKKTKTRHLQDHGAMEVPLDLSNCCYIFDYFKPKLFPEFDSYKASSMSSELEGLLLKISKVIPQDARPENSLELVQGYVDGSNDKAPFLPEGFNVSSTVVQELYYLLADYYFKNKDFGKAIKFYVHDICVSPDRLDSWAGMALARVGRLDLKLNNSTDTKSDGPIFKHGVAALRCFKRALEIDATNYSLWIEYGSYAYILHSHASRQIKQKDQLKVSDEDVVSLSTKQAEMLEQADHCFKQASMCEGEGDEEWLVHYMLGKVAEKRLLMEESLRHYLKASYHLHESEARYPKKIPYHNPSDFSLEALEMYFRIHSAILKLVQCSLPGTKVKLGAYGTLEGLVQEAANLPFVRAEEKKREPSSEHSTDTEQETRIRPSKPDTPPSLAPKRHGSPVYVATPQDHDYLHEKYRRSRSRVSSQEDPTTDTASESDIFSGDESMSSFLSAQRSTISLRPVPARRSLSAAEAQATQPILDGKPSISEIGEGWIPKDEEGMIEEAEAEGLVKDPEDTKEEIPAIVISKPSPESEAATDKALTSAEDNSESEKPNEVITGMEPTSVGEQPSSDSEPAVRMDSGGPQESQHVFVAPAPAIPIEEEKNLKDEGITNVKSSVAMDMDDDATGKNNAEETSDLKETDGESLRVKEEDLERDVDESNSVEKMEVGSSSGTEVQEGENRKETLGNQEVEAQMKTIAEEQEKRRVEEDTAEGMPPDSDMKSDEDIKDRVVVVDTDKDLQGKKEEGAQDAIKAKDLSPDMEDKDKVENEDVEGEPTTFDSDEKKDAKISEHRSKETSPSDLPTQETTSQQEAPVTEIEGKANEELSTDNDATKDRSGVDALTAGDGILSRGNKEKQEQGHEVDGGTIDKQSHTVADGHLKPDGESGEDKPYHSEGPGDRSEDCIADKEAALGSSQGKENDKKVDDKEEKRVQDETELDVEEKMDTNITKKGDTDQSKEDDNSKTVHEIEGSKTEMVKKEDTANEPSLTNKTACRETEQMMEGETKDGTTEQQKDEGDAVEVDEETKKRHLQLIDACLGAMRLCLQRFPQHYKAAYRMAYLYAYAPTHKNLTWSKDILIGAASGYPPKTPADHIVAPGLFSEQHKSKNLFQGIWRNPIQDIDRSGSFPWHMYRSVALLVYILRELKDHILLLQVTTKLYRIPEQGKKYLRDADRHFLAREAFDSYRGTIRDQLASPSITGEERLGLTLSSYKCFQYTQVKQPTLSTLAAQLLIRAYSALKGNAIEAEPPVLEQATRFCEQHISFNRPPRTPTHSEGAFPRGFHRDSPSSSSSTRHGLSTDARRPVGRSVSSGSDQGGEPMDHDGKMAARRAEALDATEGVSRESKTSAQGSTLHTTQVKPPVDSSVQDSLRDGEKGIKDREQTQQEKSSAVLEQEGSKRGELTSSGTPEGGVKRKFSQVESTGENIASIVREAARQYEKTEAQRKERLGKVSSAVPQAKRFAGGMTEPSSTQAMRSQPRVHIGAMGSVMILPRDVPQQRPVSLGGTSKQTVSSASSANVMKTGLVKKAVRQPSHFVARDPSQRSEATANKPAPKQSTIKSPLSPTSGGSFADSFQMFLKTQQQQVSAVVNTYSIPSSESTLRQNPISMVTSGTLLGQVGVSKVKQASSGSTNAATVAPRPLGAPTRPTTSHGTSQPLPSKPRVGISQVAKITSSSTSVQKVRQGSEVIPHREPSTGQRQYLDQGYPTRDMEGNVSRPEVASRTIVKAGSSLSSKGPQGSGDDLLSIIDSTEDRRN